MVTAIDFSDELPKDKKPEPSNGRFDDLVVGLLVHYINSRGVCSAAVVTKIRTKSEGLVELVIFGGVYARSEHYTEAAALLDLVRPGKHLGTWHRMADCGKWEH